MTKCEKRALLSQIRDFMAFELEKRLSPPPDEAPGTSPAPDPQSAPDP